MIAAPFLFDAFDSQVMWVRGHVVGGGVLAAGLKAAEGGQEVAGRAATNPRVPDADTVGRTSELTLVLEGARQ